MRNNLIRRFTERPAAGFHSSFRRTPESRVEVRGRQTPHQSKTSTALDPGDILRIERRTDWEVVRRQISNGIHRIADYRLEKMEMYEYISNNIRTLNLLELKLWRAP